MASTVADADPIRIEAAARQFGESRRYLAPVAWAAGALVLLVRGIKLLAVNWRLALIELIPAAYVWFAMYELKQHALRGAAFREFTPGVTVVVSLGAVMVTIAAFWCNTVFAHAIGSPRPEIGPAVRRTNGHLPAITAAGVLVGLVVAAAMAGVPRIGSTLLYAVVLSGVLSLLLVSLVAVPARLIGTQRRRLPMRETIGQWSAGSALSGVAMLPGAVLDRLGVLLLGVPGLHILGLVLLTVGTLLFAAGMSSVRAVKLIMKLG